MSKKLKPHAVEMLRLIGSVCHDAGDGDYANRLGKTPRYWYPQNRVQLASDQMRAPDGMACGSGKYARRITALGRIYLDEFLLPPAAARQAELARRRALTQAERDAEDEL